MKILTIAVPTYNSEAYLERCLDSVLQPADERLEVIVVDDGSKDGSAAIAKRYTERYPSIVRLISKENGGHGSAVNTGLEAATGAYYYVLDSDDRLDAGQLEIALDRLSSFVKLEEESRIDLYLVNYIYDKVGEKAHCISYEDRLPVGQTFSWNKLRRLGGATFLTMHSMIYRTKLLRDCGLKLPEHCFYVDNVLAYKPLIHVHRIFYDDLDLYYYFIGRDDQSVTMENMIRRIDQQIRVTKLMVSAFDPYRAATHYRLRHYLLSYLSIMMTISTVHLQISGTAENLAKMKELWAWVKEENPKVYRFCRMKPLNHALLVPGMSPKVIRQGYKLARKLYKFN